MLVDRLVRFLYALDRDKMTLTVQSCVCQTAPIGVLSSEEALSSGGAFATFRA